MEVRQYATTRTDCEVRERKAERRVRPRLPLPLKDRARCNQVLCKHARRFSPLLFASPAGEGSRDAVVGVLGMVTGAGILVVGFNLLEPLALALGDLGKVTIPKLLGSSPWSVIGGLAAITAAVLWIISRLEPRRVGNA